MKIYKSAPEYNRNSTATAVDFAEGKKKKKKKKPKSCWKGYERTPGKKAGEPGSCRPKTYAEEDFSEKKKSSNKKDKKKIGVVLRSNRKNKKFMVHHADGTTTHFGAKNHSIKVGKDKGKEGSASDAYCARSAKIEGSGRANELSRRMWGCVGDQAHPDKALKLGDKV